MHSKIATDKSVFFKRRDKVTVDIIDKGGVYYPPSCEKYAETVDSVVRQYMHPERI